MPGPIYSIIDIETTGGHRYGNRIIEIAIINFCDGEIIKKYETLIHPERFIPVSISYFTGITNEMVVDAPKFHQIAKKIVEMTSDSIFVAHNVYFDFNFIKTEFASFGYHFNRPKLCTVKLARKIIPGHRSYSLGKVCNDLGIEIKNRHRAMGDADATVELLKILLAKKPDLHEAADEFKEKKILLPPNVERDEYDKLPNSPGVYYFWTEDGDLLYVGKSKDIKKRIASHFRIDIQSAKEREMKGAIHRITFDLTGSDLCAKLLECHQIKKLKPQFNRAMRRVQFPCALTWSEDMYGFLKPDISIIKDQKFKGTVIRMHNKKAAQKRVARIYDQAFGLDMDSMFFSGNLANFKKTLGRNFNDRIFQVLKKNDYPSSAFHLVKCGRLENETAYIIVEEEKISRIEYWNEDGCAHAIALDEDQDMKEILLKHLHSEARAFKDTALKNQGEKLQFFEENLPSDIDQNV